VQRVASAGRKTSKSPSISGRTVASAVRNAVGKKAAHGADMPRGLKNV